MKTSITTPTSRVRAKVRSVAVSLCCLSAFVLAAGLHAQMSPFFNRFAGNLNGDDMNYMIAAGEQLYGKGNVGDGASDTWLNPKSGNGGTITVLQSFARDGMPCRKVRYDVRLAGHTDTRSYTADWCKTPGGVWKMLS
jgi:surface antigen